MAALDQLIHDLRADGSLDSEGHFTLDREQARAKMQKFQLVDARRYVLELVQAAILRDATALRFEIDADDMRLEFDGRAFTPAEVDDLYGSLFAGGDDRALRGVRQLALALNAALGMDPKYVHLRSGGVELRMVPGKRDEIITHDKPVSGTQIHVRQRLQIRVFVDFFKNLIGQIAEDQHLRDRCMYATVPILRDGKQLSAGLGAGEPGLAEHELVGSNFRGVVRVVEDAGYCQLRLVKDGVWIDSKELRACGTRLRAVVEGDRLSKDVSQARIVEDVEYESIVTALVEARWTLWKRAFEQARLAGNGERLRALIDEQLLAHVTLEQLRANEDAQALAAGLSWPDCRGSSRQVSLMELIDHGGGGRDGDAKPDKLRYAGCHFEGLEPSGAPIILLETQAEIDSLSRLLGYELVTADSLLERERRRELGRRAWRSRRGPAKLPDKIDFAIEAPIDLDLEAGSIRGEIGVDVQTLAEFGIQRSSLDANQGPIYLFLYKDGCLLGRTELELGLPNLWMALEAEFTPNDDYSDVVRDAAFMPIFLHALAALRAPFTRWLVELAGQARAPLARGMVKRWLAGLVDPSLQRKLLTRAGADVNGRFFVRPEQLLPGLTGDRLTHADADPLAQVPLFQALTGPEWSLADLAKLVEAQGKLSYLEARPEDPRVNSPEVLILGLGDRAIVRALLGERCLEAWDPTIKQRELEFWDRTPRGLAQDRAEVEDKLASGGAVTVPATYVVDLPAAGPTRGHVYFECFDDEIGPEDLARSVRIGIRHTGRELCSVVLFDVDAGLCGPIAATVEHPGLTPTPGFDDVERDAAFDEVIAAVRLAIEALHRQAYAGLGRERGGARRWLAKVLLHGVASRAERRAAAERAPLLVGVDGRDLSLAQLATILTEHGRIEFVSTELGAAPITDPPVVVVDPPELELLRALLPGKPDRFVDASARVRHHRVYDLLYDRPPLPEAKLDPSQVFGSIVVRGDHQVGELGLARGRTSPGLNLTLGLAGRAVETLTVETGFFVPVDAVVIDEDLPLDGEGQVERNSKRVKGLIRTCRRRVPELIQVICDAWPSMPERERERVWPLITAHLKSEAKQERRQAREQAYQVAAAVPGFRDVRGRRLGLSDLLGRSNADQIDVLADPEFATLRLELPALDRPILIVDEAELECLEAHARVRRLDAAWPAELAAIEALSRAPEVELPNIDEVAFAYRKAMVAGDLECDLWLAREPSLFESGPPELICARAGRELGRGRAGLALPCAGIVTGAGLVVLGGAPVFDERQLASLERQQVILYLDLAKLVGAGKLAKADHDRALEYLAWAATHLDRVPDDLRGHGKHARALREALDLVVPPALRAAVGRRKRGPVESAPEPEQPEQPEPVQASEAASNPAESPTIASSRDLAIEREPAQSESADRERAGPTSPDQRLLAAVFDQLRWARARHTQVETLLLDNLSIRAWGAGEVALLDRGAVAINQDHPIVTRLLGQDPHDPIDLSFLVAALYSTLNYEAEAISDDDEREFVAQLAQTLAVTTRLDHG